MQTNPSPLLGSAYLKSQSAPSPKPLPATPSLCLNLSLFKSHLKSLRAVDDSIILRINRSDALSRALASSPPNRENSTVGQTECNAFWDELTEGWNGRNSILSGCLDVMDKSIKVEQYGVENGLDRNRTAMGRGETELQVKVKLKVSLSFLQSSILILFVASTNASRSRH